MKRRNLWLSAIGKIVLILFLAGCSKNTQVVGVLVTDDGEPLPEADVELWLASAESGEFEGTADIEVAYEARTDDSGAFAFRDVQPGYYALSCWAVLPSGFPETGFLCITPDSEAPEVIGGDYFEDCSGMFVIEAEKGQEIDLGEILVRF